MTKIFDYESVNINEIKFPLDTIRYRGFMTYDNMPLFIRSSYVQIVNICNLYVDILGTKEFKEYYIKLINRVTYVLWRRGKISYYKREEILQKCASLHLIKLFSATLHKIEVYDSRGNKLSFSQIKRHHCQILFSIDPNDVVLRVHQIKCIEPVDCCIDKVLL